MKVEFKKSFPKDKPLRIIVEKLVRAVAKYCRVISLTEVVNIKHGTACGMARRGSYIYEDSKSEIDVTLSKRFRPDSYLFTAERFVEICIHEFGHVRDFHERLPKNIYDDYGRSWNWKNKWAKRPHERRACAYVEQKNKDLPVAIQELILEAAIEYEAYRDRAEKGWFS